MKQVKRMYAVAITNAKIVSESDIMFFAAVSYPYARKDANLYRKQCDIKEKIFGIELIPHELENNDLARREYAAARMNTKYGNGAVMPFRY